MSKTWNSCLPFSFSSKLTLARVKALFTRKPKSEVPEEGQYALLSDFKPEPEPQPQSKPNSIPTITCKYLEDLEALDGDTQATIQDHVTVQLASEYLHPQTPPKAETNANAEVELKERYVGFGIGGAGNMRRVLVRDGRLVRFIS